MGFFSSKSTSDRCRNESVVGKTKQISSLFLALCYAKYASGLPQFLRALDCLQAYLPILFKSKTVNVIEAVSKVPSSPPELSPAEMHDIDSTECTF